MSGVFLFEKFLGPNTPTRVSARVGLIQVLQNGRVSVFPPLFFI